MKIGDTFYIAGHLCQIKGTVDGCWIGWMHNNNPEAPLNYEDLDKVFYELFGESNLSKITREHLKHLDPNIHYLRIDAFDSPDFGDIESLCRFVKLLDTYILGKKIKKLNS